jgi:hypothetical protein
MSTVWYLSIGFRSYADSMVFFFWISYLFRQCGIFLLNFVALLTVWYFSIGFRSYSDSKATKSNKKIPHCQHSYEFQQDNTTLSA